MTLMLQNDDSGGLDRCRIDVVRWGTAFVCGAMSFYEYMRARRRFPGWDEIFRPFSVHLAIILIIHFMALVGMGEAVLAVLPKVLFLLSWGMLNCFWLMVSRRPGVSAALSITMIVALILVSRLKH